MLGCDKRNVSHRNRHQLTQYATARTSESPFARQMVVVPVTQPYNTQTKPLIAIEEYCQVRVWVGGCARCVAGRDSAKEERVACRGIGDIIHYRHPRKRDVPGAMAALSSPSVLSKIQVRLVLATAPTPPTIVHTEHSIQGGCGRSSVGRSTLTLSLPCVR